MMDEKHWQKLWVEQVSRDNEALRDELRLIRDDLEIINLSLNGVITKAKTVGAIAGLVVGAIAQIITWIKIK